MKLKNENMEWEMEAPTLASLPRINSYRVPDNYFNDLTAQINAAVFLDGLYQKEGTGFTTPSSYFNKLQANILDQTVNIKPAIKVIRFWHRDLMKYAAAACFILLAASGLYVNEQSKVKEALSSELASEAMLYDIDESVIIEHLKESQTATNTSASQAEIESYILDHYSSNDLSNNL
ncbi:MAG: hypothetical protein H7202_07960 [Pedobacter sp.]|nr:hypothetical protein [Pedobacter sp.]